MHSVPLVEDSYMNRRFKTEGLPMILVRSWDEIAGWDEVRVRTAYEAAIVASDPKAAFLEHWKKRCSPL
jgi:hypothetical protein